MSTGALYLGSLSTKNRAGVFITALPAGGPQRATAFQPKACPALGCKTGHSFQARGLLLEGD